MIMQSFGKNGNYKLHEQNQKRKGKKLSCLLKKKEKFNGKKWDQLALDKTKSLAFIILLQP